jgi:integrase
MRISILLGQRTGQWKQYTVHNDHVVFPAASMKGRIEHILPLTHRVRAELEGFRPPLRYKQRLDLLRKAVPQIPDFRPHDTRRYLSSTMSRLQPRVDIDVTEAILAHTTGSRSAIQRVYDRDARLPQMRQALERYERHLFSSVLAGTDSE